MKISHTNIEQGKLTASRPDKSGQIGIILSPI
jgi:hypothetical protein